MTLFGPDISNNNGTVDEAQVQREGFSFVFAKVSEGSYFADTYWPATRDACKALGLPYIGYHYVTTDDPAAQAAKFVNNGGGANAMLDVEANSGDIANFWAVVNAFNAAGVNIALSYIPHWYWEEIGSPDLSQVPGLIASSYVNGTGYASALYPGDGGVGWQPYGGAQPVMWQFTDKAQIAGKTLDANAFRGTPEQLAALLGATVPPTPPVTSTPEPSNPTPTTGGTMSNPNANASPQSIADSLDGILDGKPLDYRIVDMLRVRQLGDVASNTDPAAPGTAGPNAEGANRSTSVLDQAKTLADVLTGRWEINGKYYDLGELLYLVAVKLGVGS